MGWQLADSEGENENRTNTTVGDSCEQVVGSTQFEIRCEQEAGDL